MMSEPPALSVFDVEAVVPYLGLDPQPRVTATLAGSNKCDQAGYRIYCLAAHHLPVL